MQERHRDSQGLEVQRPGDRGQAGDKDQDGGDDKWRPALQHVHRGVTSDRLHQLAADRDHLRGFPELQERHSDQQ